MQRSIPVSVAILLAACGVAATSSNDAAESATQKSRGKAKQQPRIGFENFDRGGMAGCFDPRLSGQARAAAERIGGVPCETGAAGNNAGGDPWVGAYQGPADEGMTAIVSIARGSGPNRYRAEIGVSGPGCVGVVEGNGVVAGNRMSLVVPVPEEREQCLVYLDRSGSRINLTEAGGCQYFHGAQCRFDATVSRRRAASAAPRGTPTAPARQASWLVGAWVSRGFACGGDGVIYEANGTYSSDAQSGRWQLSGNTLTETALQMVEMGEGETPVRNPRPARSQILSVAPNRNAFTMRTADGEVWNMVRCR